MNRTSPKVSVVMGAYNSEATIDEAIESIVSQTYSKWELIVCDDASTDSTWNHIVTWQQRHPSQITVLRNGTNRKLAATLNQCLRHASGELIARMDADDRSHPDRFARQVDFLAENPALDLVGTSMRRFSAAGPANIVAAVRNPDRYALRSRTPFCHATIMAKRSVFTALGGYSEDKSSERVEDVELWFRFYELGFAGGNIQEALYWVREDMAAIRRRTPRNRWNLFKLRCQGFRRLGYPNIWLVGAAVDLAKVFVPARVTAIVRRVQSRRGAG